jgi:hypothetical protein
MRFRRICRYAFAALTASMAGCASSPGRPSPGTGRERVSVQTTQVNYDIPLTVDARETKAVLEMRADTVWRAVPLAYAAMSIPTACSFEFKPRWIRWRPVSRMCARSSKRAASARLAVRYAVRRQGSSSDSCPFG